MAPDSYKFILLGSLAGAVMGPLVVWNRKRSQVAERSNLRSVLVLTVGGSGGACAMAAFAKALAPQSPVYAAIAMIVMTGWAALLHSVKPLPLPRFALRVRAAEFYLLRWRWTAVRLFGALLRRTFLRHLGGRVYLSEQAGDAQTVLRGIYDAEGVHLYALLLCCPWLIWWGLWREWMCLAAGVAIQGPLNIFPILHLRYTAWRVERLEERLRARKQFCAAGERILV